MIGTEIAAIILSDLHLGAIGNNKPQFFSFLKRMIKSPPRHLILAGDFMDLMCEPISQIDRGAHAVFDALQALLEKGTDTYMLLGNHEIPVIGPYDVNPASLTNENFQEKLADFKSKLTAAINFQKILPKIKFGQYALVEKYNTTWYVQTFNSILQVKLNPGSECHALIAHGFQFDLSTPDHSETWKNALEAPDSLKDVMDFFFNGAIRPIRNVFKPSIWEGGPGAVKNAIQTHKSLHKHAAESNSLIHLIDESPTQVQNFSGEYLKTISKRKYDLPSIIQDMKNLVEHTPNLHDLSHILFGHTHEMWVVEEPGKPTIINTGAWQHVRKMTYLEIDSVGNFHVKHIRSKTYLLNLLVGIILVGVISSLILALIFGK